METTTRFTIDELSPKYLNQPERFNDWYFTVHFVHEGQPCLAKFSITEGSLLGQTAQLTFSRDPLHLAEEPDATVLHPSVRDISLVEDGGHFAYSVAEDEVRIEMGSLTAICRPDQQRIISSNQTLGADLTCTPRGPVLHWKHAAGAVCQVTEVTRVSGSESLSDVRGTLTINGQTIPVEGRGLFERVWFSALNFFEIRAMNWIYAHFDELYVYICHCESVTSESRPFHFETGETYLVAGDDFMAANSLEVTPESWVYLAQARRFIPLEQNVVVRTDRGTLRLRTRLAHYPLLAQDPVRLEGLTIDNIAGWTSLFYDAPIALKGTFTYADGRVVQLAGGVGINEQIRISAL